MWTVGAGMVGLGHVPGYEFFSGAADVSADGSVVVGGSRSESDNVAFIWDDANGMRNVQDLLVSDLGLDLSGWTLKGATGVSDDNLTIVGYGYNPSGFTEGWIAHIPEPSTVLLLMTASLLALRRRRK